MILVSDATYLNAETSAEAACGDTNAYCVGNWENCGGEDGAKQFFGATDCCQGTQTTAPETTAPSAATGCPSGMGFVREATYTDPESEDSSEINCGQAYDYCFTDQLPCGDPA